MLALIHRRTIIDCDADPIVADDEKIEEHRAGGQFDFDPTRVGFYLSDGQKDGRTIDGRELRKELVGRPVLNANVLHHLLANPHLIPEDWKTDGRGNPRHIYFWGTIYRVLEHDGLYVRALWWNERRGEWSWILRWLHLTFNHEYPATVLAKGEFL